MINQVSGEVRSTHDGSLRVPGFSFNTLSGNALMSSSGRTLLHAGGFDCCPTCDCVATPAGVVLSGYPSGSAASTWDLGFTPWIGVGLSMPLSNTVASSQGDVLVTGQGQANRGALLGVTSSGATRFTCDIPAPPAFLNDRSRYTTATLLEGRLASVEWVECSSCLHNPPPRLRVFEVPGETKALHGWTGPWGNPSGSSRPLP